METARRRRTPIVIAWTAAFVAFTVLALAFDANGAPYHAWSRAFGILSFAALLAAISALVFRPRLTGRRLTIAIAGVALAAVALLVTVVHYGDSTGSTTRADALAWAACAALLVSTAALALPAGRR